MRIASPPALLPALAFLAALQAMRYALPAPIGALGVLLLFALSLGGRPGRALGAAALGALLAQVAPAADPPLAYGSERPVTAVGSVCGHPRTRGDRVSMDLCVERLRWRDEIVAGRWLVRLDAPAPEAGIPLGTRVRATGAMGRAPGFDNAHRSLPGRWSLRVKSARFVRIEGEPPAGLAFAGVLRARVEGAWRRAGSHRGAALARAMVLGDTAGMPPAWQRALRRTGLAHLTAASGFNVALVAGFVALALAFAPRGTRLAGAGAATLGYLALVGPEPAMVRATAMALAVFVGLATRRAPLALHTLSLAAALMAAADPRLLDDVGFRLSVTATGGLILLGPVLARRLARSLPASVAMALGASIAAQAVSAPFAVAAFGQVAPAAALLNLLFVPLAAAALALGLLASALALAGVAAPPLAIVWLLDAVALPFDVLPRLPASPIWTIAVPAHVWVGAAAGCLGVALAVSHRARRALALAALCLTSTEHGRGGPEEVHVAVLDVGQGDAILVRSRRHAVLIDGGGAVGRDLAVAALLPALAAHGVARLDAVALSHFDLDHCAGLLDLAGSVPVRQLWLPATAAETTCSREVVGAFGGRPRELAAGDGITLGALRFTVLHPDRTVARREGNAPSLVLRLDALGRRALFTGDLDGAAERELASRYGASLACDLLKVAHHGSSRSSGPELLAAVRPRLAIVSAGVRNVYGHPSDGALDRLRRSGARVLRTDRDGGVEVWWRAGEPWRLALPGSPRRTTARR